MGSCVLPQLDDVNITFNQDPTVAIAGPDQTGPAMCGLTSTTLAANNPVVGTGLWTIIGGAGGTYYSTDLVRQVHLHGVAGTAYTLTMDYH